MNACMKPGKTRAECMRRSLKEKDKKNHYDGLDADYLILDRSSKIH